ncbi:MAG: class I SAM-dependent methyltransferase [Minisyncoccia bacterium]
MRLPSDKDAKILDFGCGFGQTLKELMKLGYKNVIGCDVDKNALEIARQHGLNVENCSDLDSFSRKYQDYFDFIIMSHVLEHFPKDRIVPALKSIRAMLKSGVLFIMVPNAQSNTGAYWAYEDFTHFTLFTSGSIYYVLKMAGFDEIEFVDIECLEGIPFIKRMIKKFLLRLYKFNIHFWNRVTSSSFHKPSPEIYSFEIKVIARKL